MSLLQQLLALHRVDVQVRSLRSRLQQADRYLATQQRQLDELLSQRTDVHNQQRQMQAQLATLEVEGKSIAERVEKLRRELNQSANTKQYNALLQELKTLESQKDALDEQALAQMERIEQVAKRLAGFEPLAAERRRLRDEAQAECEQRRKDTSDRLGELEAEIGRAHV